MTRRQLLRAQPLGRDFNRNNPILTPQHAYGPRANRRRLGLTNKAHKSRQATQINGETELVAQPKALRRLHIVSSGPGAKLIAHQRGAGFQHGPGDPMVDEVASFRDA